MRPDLLEAQRDAWRSLGGPDSSWSARQRHELATTALAAICDPDPAPAWVAISTIEGRLSERPLAPALAHDTIHRVARHAGTCTRSWYDRAADDLGPIAVLELVGIACVVAAVTSLRHAAGLDPWQLPDAGDEEPTGKVATEVVEARLNWVPVVAPADRRAAVVQAFSAVPETDRTIWALADAQYIPDLEMVDPRWTRGTLTRPQMELLATRVAEERECFY